MSLVIAKPRNCLFPALGAGQSGQHVFSCLALVTGQHVFPRLAFCLTLVTCFPALDTGHMLSLVHCVICVCCDWPVAITLVLACESSEYQSNYFNWLNKRAGLDQCLKSNAG